MTMFSPLAYPEILARLVAHVRASNEQLTDFNVGSVTRSWLEAAAIGLDELWMGATQAITEAIPQAVFSGFDFTKLPATYALGAVTFYITVLQEDDLIIPAGTRVRLLGGRAEYLTLASATLEAGDYEVTTLARAAQPGPDANTEVGGLSVIVNGSEAMMAAAVASTNRQPIINGRYEETDAEQRVRFADYIAALARGTLGALEYGARLATIEEDGVVVEQVHHVALIETPGRVELYLHNGAGSTTPALVARAQALIDGYRDDAQDIIAPGYRPAGMAVVCHAITDVPLTVTATITLAAGYVLADVIVPAQTALTSLVKYLSGDRLTVPAIINTLYGVPGIADLTLLAPIVSQTYLVHQRPVYGTVTLTEA